jgi:hypothetical protein
MFGMVSAKQQKKKNKELPVIYSDKKETGTLGLEKPFTRISFVCYLREKLEDCISRYALFQKLRKSFSFLIRMN